MDQLSLAVAVTLALATLVAVLLAVRRGRRREARDTAQLELMRSEALHIPPTLHPVIDPALCMGSLACVKACPEGDIIGIVDGKATLIEGSRCLGHGRCEAACPTGAISLVFGTSERGVDLPRTDAFFETSRPGVHIVGELGGMGLIKNAVRQGVRLVGELHGRLDGRQGADERVDVAIVGAGPAGMATALACRDVGLSFRVLEQDTVGGTIAHYPRQKVVMTETVRLPGYGDVGRATSSKEELLESFHDALAHAKVRVEERVRVTGIAGEDGAFEVQTSQGAVPARKVVLALGRRGTPRTLEAPGEELAKVTYRLIDPSQYEDRDVLVVGGGDSALEAAIMLADESSARVGISYRQPAFGRCRPANRDRVKELIDAGRISAHLGTTVSRIGVHDVELVGADGPRVLPNDFVIVNVGGVLPTELLRSTGVEVEQHIGDLARAVVPGRRILPRPHRALGVVLVTIGALLVAGLAAYGWDYYRLAAELRPDSPLHERLKPAGTWGHGIGVIATGVMMLNFLYAARKRIGALDRLGSLRTWLALHVFIGSLTPIVIAFHAAFQSNNLLATSTAGSLVVVVVTGLLGRFIFGMVPTAEGRVVPLQDVESRWKTVLAELEGLTAASRDAATLQRLIAGVRAVGPAKGSFLGALLRMPTLPLFARARVTGARRLFAEPADYGVFRRTYVELVRARAQIAFYGQLRRLLTVWRAFHVVLSILLIVIISLHIALSYYLGYRWIF